MPYGLQEILTPTGVYHLTLLALRRAASIPSPNMTLSGAGNGPEPN